MEEKKNQKDLAGNPYEQLAAAIIIKAIEDLRAVGEEKRICIEGSIVTKEALLNFFGSDWCGTLLSFQNSVSQNELFIEALNICS